MSLMHSRALRSRRGVTITEVMMTSAIGLIVVVALLYMFVDNTQRVRNITAKLEDRLTGVVVDQFLWRDFSQASMSFSGLNTKDDEGRGLFDWYVDAEISAIPENLRTRKLTISATSKVKEITFLTSPNDAPLKMIDPAAMYLSEPPTSLGTSGKLEFRGFQYMDYMKNLFGSHWVKGDVFLLFAPVWLKPAGRTQDPTVPPRQPSWLGIHDGNTLIANDLGGVFDFRFPIDQVSAIDPDRFLRLAPPVGGASVMMMATKVVPVRYTLRERASVQGTYELVRSTWSNSAFQSPMVVGVDIDQLIIHRRATNLGTLSYEVTFRKRP
jgi:hypothetical protein